MPLNLVEKNKTYTIQRIAGKESVVHRLQELGFVPGTEVSVLSEINGNFLITVKGAKIGLGREYVKYIIVA